MPDNRTHSAALHELEHLMTLHPKGYDLSLERISVLLEKLGNPQNNMPPTIHIAGTNGKGSAAAFCTALLQEAGLKVHTHTSPHLVRWHERYRIHGKIVEDEVFADALRRIARANNGADITVFEILTATTFLLFSEIPADAAIVEVGLGGRFDATNVLKNPAVSLIMPISLDHQAWLGDRVEMIAAEKAGIIKSGVPVVIGMQEHDKAHDVIEGTANRLGCPLKCFGQDFFAYEENGRLVYQDSDVLFDLALPKLIGRHQYANAAASIAAVRAAGFDIGHRAADSAMQSVKWPGRMQRLDHGDLVDLSPKGAQIWLDGGHNPGAGMAIGEEIALQGEHDERPLYMISGMLNAKDHTGYFRAFEGLARHVYTVPIPEADHSVPNDILASHARAAGLSAEPVESIENALQLLRDTLSEDDLPPRILICGSLYVVGAVLKRNGTPPV